MIPRTPRDTDPTRIFTRRALLLGGGQAALMAVLVGRLYYLQIIESDTFRRAADRNRFTIRLIPPPRGEITDRFGVPMALNRRNYQVSVISEDIIRRARTIDERITAVNGVLRHLGRVVTLPEFDIERVLTEVRKHRAFVPIPIRENLTWDEMARIQVNKPSLPGILIEEGLTRFYPQAELSSHLLGYVSSVAEEDLMDDDDPLLHLPGFRIGKQGIERSYDRPLRGTAGARRMEVNAYGRVMAQQVTREATRGQKVALTIDMRLQEFAARRLGEESAGAVVMDVHTGEILALVSTPGYEPNAFSRGLTPDEWSALSKNPRAPMINKAVGGQYSPGSTFKMVVALAGLEAGVMSPNEYIYCPGHTQLGSHRFHCWKRGGHGAVNLVAALAGSCDVYFYEIARRCGVDRIAAMARKLGMGELLDIGVNGERPGLMPTRAWKLATRGENWHPGETLNVGIGQGYVLTTPLQLALMTARIANGGLKVMPTLCRQTPDELLAGVPADRTLAAAAPESLNIPKAHLDLVRFGMWSVINGGGGTARRSAIPVPGWELAGKTGTTQVRRITAAERAAGVRKAHQLPWEHRDHALFVCYAPYDAPRYACSVIVEHGGGGSSVAAPIARDIMMEALRLDPSVKAPGQELAIDDLPPRARELLLAAYESFTPDAGGANGTAPSDGAAQPPAGGPQGGVSG
ncbi:penicillin-binding protein 2 [Phaeovibrio sulfidiphilus]|uniref:Penicillin-binding protein 2 n=1 Tax=Phaeovibrio sulfidiphilus TaxID=1220600 RepID=A0A8J7CQY8_9PROT|nr:penicillin-binding protein 2 [Phaeovibrio sulfidiphilus]MBE1237350.1 penicillin-binding protein 2 [Phaeovibrio sulfidiphilus]